VKVPVDRLLARPTVAGLAEEVAELRAEQDERRQARVLERLSSLSDEEAAMELVRLETATAGGGEP